MAEDQISAEGNTERVEQGRREDVRFRERRELHRARCIIPLIRVVSVCDLFRVIVRVPGEKRVRIGQILIQTDLPIVFRCRLDIRERVIERRPREVFSRRVHIRVGVGEQPHLPGNDRGGQDMKHVGVDVAGCDSAAG